MPTIENTSPVQARSHAVSGVMYNYKYDEEIHTGTVEVYTFDGRPLSHVTISPMQNTATLNDHVNQRVGEFEWSENEDLELSDLVAWILGAIGYIN